MPVFARNRYALNIGLAATLLVGCGAPQPLIGAPAIVPQSRAAAPDARRGPCVYLLSTTEASNLSNTQIMARDCYIYINATANMSYSTITAAKIIYAGAPPNETGATFPEATPAPGPAVSDPCSTLPGCDYATNHPPSVAKCGPFGNYNNATISPGCYKGLNLTGTDTLNPGLYVIDGQFHLENSSVTGKGVAIYLTANVTDTNFAGSRLTLSAPRRGNYKDVLFYRPPSQSAGVDLSTCTCDFTGILYFPTTSVDYSDTGGNYQLLIFGQANLSNDENLRLGPP